MLYCAAQCGVCGDIVLATSPTQPTICSCKDVTITGNECSSTIQYKKQEPRSFQMEIEDVPPSGIIKDKKG